MISAAKDPDRDDEDVEQPADVDELRKQLPHPYITGQRLRAAKEERDPRDESPTQRRPRESS